ncbi:hypothetical protein ANO11243_035250 [Dothideomycetidae sp. 11243]|nr:hypothetical protein ANO11243_035250 [fungal sp. No.11243]
MAASTSSAPFSRAVVNAMRKLYPEALADKSFDNTGLLLEAPFDPIRRQMNSAMLTIDLTKAVADEAIERSDSIIIAYHPIIFRGLKSLTLADSQQKTLLRLAAEGISVYSPHTAVDAAAGGLGDWLADIVTGTPIEGHGSDTAPDSPKPASSTRSVTSSNDKDKLTDTIDADENDRPSVQQLKRPTYQLQHHPSQLEVDPAQRLELSATQHTRAPIVPSSVPGHEGAGMGRIIRKIAICAGSGAGVFSSPAAKDADLLFTGELSHHDALAAIENGKAVIALFHSNTERGFLHDVLKGQLLNSVKEEWAKLREEEKESVQDEDYLDALGDESVEIHVN